MKKDTKSHFTKLTQKRGISLIVLIITIIVVIILAAAVILTISNNNPVESAREARFKEDIRSMQDELSTYLSSEYVKDLGGFDPETENFEKEEMVKKLPSTKAYKEKVKVEKGKLVYISEELTENEIKWMEALDISEKGIDAQTVSKDPKKYYGEYVLNYETGNKELDENIDWKIFYADENNIYLIAADYVPVKYLPKAIREYDDGTFTEYEFDINGECTVTLNTQDWNTRYAIAAYTGSENITDTRLQALNSSYYNYLTSNNETSTAVNMRAVAYMMDIRKKVWGTYVGNKADYAIGGPTVEMLLKSYNQKHDVDYRAQATSIEGYQLSKDGGKTWVTSITTDGTLSLSDDLYVISASDRKAECMWLASPSRSYSNRLVGVHYNGWLGDAGYNAEKVGCRPLICLKSEVMLKAVEGGYVIN